MICPVCDLEIKEGEKRRIVPCDRPYFNVYCHLDCINTLTDEYFQIPENLQKFVDTYRNYSIKTRKNKPISE